MAVDYDNLKVIKTDIETRRAANRAEWKNLRAIYSKILSIEKIRDPADPTQEIRPKDEKLDATISVARTDSIYDKIVADQAKL